MKEKIFQVRKKDLRVDYFRAGGPGGQHQNKTSSACRITHIATGISAESREERSQAQNKKIAFRKLVELLVQHFLKEEQKERYAAGHEVVRTYHIPDDRIVDHRTGKQYSYKHVMDKNNVEEMIDETRNEILSRRG